MSGQEFARYAGVKYQTFATWVQKRRREKSQEALVVERPRRVKWVEAEVGGEQDKADGPLIVNIGSGVRMEVLSRRGAELAAEVMRQLGVGRC